MPGDRQPTERNGEWVCRDCNVALQTTMPDGRRYRPSLRCTSCSVKHYAIKRLYSGQGEAHGIVGRAVRLGNLPHPTTLQCSDCDRMAEQYDHRDYGQPLAVDAVCRSCNHMRGPAKWRTTPEPTKAEG